MGVTSLIFSAFSTLCSTSFDIGSDLVNSLDFLGYCVSDTIAGAVSGSLSASMECENSSSLQEGSYLNSTETSEKCEEHKIWGTLGILLIFLPGIIAPIPFIVVVIFKRGYLTALKFFVGGLFYPITLILFAFTSVFQAFKDEDDAYKWTVQMVGAEAFFESFPQMILQGYTILYGHDVTNVQKVTIVASFVLLARTSIVFGLAIESSIIDEKLSLKDSMIYTMKVLPTHVTTISFRVLSFSLTIAFLRGWSCIPIFVLYMELMLLTYYRCRDEEKRQMLWPLWEVPFSNLSVINAHNLASTRTKKDIENAVKFVDFSSILTFIHHSLVLTSIMALTYLKPDYLEKDHFNHLILKPEVSYFYMTFGITIGLGFVSMILSLLTARRVVTVDD